MTDLVIGARGFIGSALLRRLGPAACGTSRREGEADYVFDLLNFSEVPPADVVYICAGANGAKACEGSQQAFLVNVDAPVRIAELVAARGGFSVYISSMSVEWLSTAYQRQKLAAEMMLRSMPAVGILRAGRVLASNINSLCDAMADVGHRRVRGVTRWGNDDIAYDPRSSTAPK
jgi:nucleoside-diphosphate-sugar epimerase